jgi:hypothetical protein
VEFIPERHLAADEKLTEEETNKGFFSRGSKVFKYNKLLFTDDLKITNQTSKEILYGIDDQEDKPKIIYVFFPSGNDSRKKFPVSPVIVSDVERLPTEFIPASSRSLKNSGSDILRGLVLETRDVNSGLKHAGILSLVSGRPRVENQESNSEEPARTYRSNLLAPDSSSDEEEEATKAKNKKKEEQIKRLQAKNQPKGKKGKVTNINELDDEEPIPVKIDVSDEKQAKVRFFEKIREYLKSKKLSKNSREVLSETYIPNEDLDETKFFDAFYLELNMKSPEIYNFDIMFLSKSERRLEALFSALLKLQDGDDVEFFEKLFSIYSRLQYLFKLKDINKGNSDIEKEISEQISITLAIFDRMAFQKKM